MANYSERFTLTLNATVADIAAKVGKGFDPDAHGEYSFHRDITGWNGEEPIYGNTISTSTPCTAEFKAQGDYLMTDANALHQALSADYAARWADLTPPTLEECQAFIASIVPQAQDLPQ